ncbi:MULTISPECIES: transcriptional regulator PtsJ [unclassified Modicisalibacter]|uniref:MocR-like B6 salvage transcription factor PtsJ n=1 Tax=unclassified Modicisalibacter TaxID=2679913 RepID=UPI001CC9B282|nr:MULTISPECIES: transcriptional regulator PtsJ [unclassified Modicisalibacter]MBZ9556511.1 transcriptional regulator PtsJ [Modicisalibacter sp. R2A 31.J]MBZ9575020.1 transcriptional regulator PtsJ [Modicisalibacter sp. MOD 31.J]
MQITGTSAAEIFDSVRLLAQSGQLQPGQSLPPVRDLATRLEVNRNTVAAAYKRLVAAGIAVTRGRLGTVIREPPRLGEQEGATPDTRLSDVASGNPNPDWLPDISEAVVRAGYRPRLYGEATVNPSLANYARQWFAGDVTERHEFELAHGAVDAIERLLAAHLVTGDRVVVETPCFLGSLNVLRVAGLEPVGVPVDREGMRVDALEHALSAGAQAVILTPRAHNPTGCGLSAQRAQALRRVLERHPHVLIVVDDHFALLADTLYHSVIPESAQRWALVRSLSKALGPDLRIALIASDPQTAERLRLRLAPGSTWVSHLLQDIAHACLTNEVVASQIALAREDYTRRRHYLTTALAERGIAVATPADGLNLWIPLQQHSRPLAFAMAKRGWLVRGGEGFSVGEPVHGLRLTVSELEESQAGQLATDLRDSVHENGDDSPVGR